MFIENQQYFGKKTWILKRKNFDRKAVYSHGDIISFRMHHSCPINALPYLQKATKRSHLPPFPCPFSLIILHFALPLLMNF